MEPCLNPRCIRWDTPLDEFLKAASSAGFPCVECFIQPVVAFADAHSEAALMDLFESFQVKLAQFSGLLPDGPILAAPVLISSADYEVALEGLDRRLAIAARLGCSRAQIVLNPCSQLEAQAARRLAKQRLNDLARHTEAYGIQLAVEFVGIRSNLSASLEGDHPVVRSLPEMLLFLEDLQQNNVGLVFDLFHWYASRGTLDYIHQIPREAFAFLQVSDVPIGIAPERLDNSLRLLPGEGVLPWDAILSAIQTAGYLGPASVEVFDPNLWTLEPHIVAERAFEYVTRYLKGEE